MYASGKLLGYTPTETERTLEKKIQAKGVELGEARIDLNACTTHYSLSEREAKIGDWTISYERWFTEESPDDPHKVESSLDGFVAWMHDPTKFREVVSLLRWDPYESVDFHLDNDDFYVDKDQSKFQSPHKPGNRDQKTEEEIIDALFDYVSRNQ